MRGTCPRAAESFRSVYRRQAQRTRLDVTQGPHARRAAPRRLAPHPRRRERQERHSQRAHRAAARGADTPFQGRRAGVHADRARRAKATRRDHRRVRDGASRSDDGVSEKVVEGQYGAAPRTRARDAGERVSGDRRRDGARQRLPARRAVRPDGRADRDARAPALRGARERGGRLGADSAGGRGPRCARFEQAARRRGLRDAARGRRVRLGSGGETCCGDARQVRGPRQRRA
mmetsp:Transcript_21412/g.85167  ORF Transcript_21412/g.85167 Transcript_21412/m.85167 type:complete len:232 (+) Transcript_21412:175-870(+)